MLQLLRQLPQSAELERWAANTLAVTSQSHRKVTIHEYKLSHVHKGFGSVRPYLHGTEDLPKFIEKTFEASILELNDEGPTLLQVGDSLIWVEAGDLPAHIKPWVGSVYVYVPDVDAAYSRAIELGARSISAPEDKPYNERQAGFIDAAGNTWWVSKYLGDAA